MSVMARCAATPSTCDSANEVTAWTSVAAPAASASGISSSARPFPMTSSMRYLEEAGSTRPASRLTSISAEAERRGGPRRAQISARASRQTSAQSSFFLGCFVVVGDTAGRRIAAAAARAFRPRQPEPAPQSSGHALSMTCEADRRSQISAGRQPRQRAYRSKVRIFCCPSPARALSQAAGADRLELHPQLPDDLPLDDVAEDVLLDVLVRRG